MRKFDKIFFGNPDNLFFIFLSIAVIFVGAIFGWNAFGEKSERKVRDCSYYAEYTLENVPARCVKYFRGEE